MDGVLLIDKPSGWTSFDVVAKIRGMVRAETGQKKPKVGHAGTLDPLATGLLVVLIGSYCKRASEFSQQDKVYEVTMKLGQTSTTGDTEGKLTVVNNSYFPLSRKIETVLKKFTGEIMQTPHKFSAIKVNGQRAYKLAREGKEVVIEPRKVTVYSISDVQYEYPEVKFTAKVSSGTYIRSLVEDIGKELGTGAYMSALRRTQVGGFALSSAHQLKDLNLKELKSRIIA